MQKNYFGRFLVVIALVAIVGGALQNWDSVQAATKLDDPDTQNISNFRVRNNTTDKMDYIQVQVKSGLWYDKYNVQNVTGGGRVSLINLLARDYMGKPLSALHNTDFKFVGKQPQIINVK